MRRMNPTRALLVLTLTLTPTLGAACSSGTAPAGAESPEASEGTMEPDMAESDTDAPLEEDEGAWEGEGAATSGGAAGDEASTGAGESAEKETRTLTLIQKIVQANRKPFRACYEKVQKDLPDLKGDLVISFVLDAEGNIKKAEHNLERSTIKNAEVATCAIAELKKLDFPPSSRGMETSVNYPFNFNPKP
jgi:hypothetical protein